MNPYEDTWFSRGPMGLAPALPPPAITERRPARADRMGPFAAGIFTGIASGAASLGVVHLIARRALEAELLRAANLWAFPLSASLAIAYGTFAAVGALVAGCFAVVTHHLRRFVPLMLWSLVFFPSMAIAVLAAVRTYGVAVSPNLTTAIFAATGTFALLAPFSLPLRRRPH